MSGIDLLGFEVFWPNSFCQALPRVVCPREGSRRGGGPWPSSGASTPSLRRANADAPPSYAGPRSTIPSGRAGSRALGWR